MLSHPSRRGRAVVFGVLVALAALVGPAPVGAVPAQDDEVFDANETEGTIERVRYQLLGVAAITGALLVGYIWHTDPSRRQRVAIRRREDRERAGVAAFDDEFVLPVDADADIDLVDEGPVTDAAPEADATEMEADVEER
ncbi:MAG: hypothetical protein AAGA90_11770 [Actinomycetota bacterium]